MHLAIFLQLNVFILCILYSRIAYGKILKESIRFRAVKKEQLIQKISCSECDSFQLYQFAETLAVIYMGIVSSPEA